MLTVKVLILGCGNIGAGYDLHQDKLIQTHAKAFSKHKNIELTVADADKQKAAIIAKHYRARVIDLDQIDFQEFSIVSIATPTSTHFSYLSQLLKLNVPVVICEKPVASGLKELSDLRRKYSKSKAKIVVNYMRRFLPGSVLLKKRIQQIRKKESPSQITIKYNRGLLNNATHALDLLEFLFDAEFKFEKFALQSLMPGAFDGDPTVVGTCRFEKAIVLFAGTKDPVFEIELLFEKYKIVIGDRGTRSDTFDQRRVPLKRISVWSKQIFSPPT